MNKLDVIKSASSLVVSAGVGTIVANAIRMTTPAEIQIPIKICVSVGSFVLTSMISEKASDFAKKNIDEIADLFTKKKSDFSEDTTTE